MATLLGCIADDFTGATDLAGLLARSGARVTLRIGVPATPLDGTSPFEVIALKSRTAPVGEAVVQAKAALAWLRQAGAGRFFWKYCSTFDSTAQGNIGPVAETLMAEIGAMQTVYCPAFPENGRAVFMGNLFVGRQPLAESPMKDHPLTPMRDSNLMRLLAPQVTGAVGLVDRLTVAQGAGAVRDALAALARGGVVHVIVDAVANADLDVIAEACRDMPLITGGSAVAMPLPSQYRAAGLLPEAAERGNFPRTEPKSIVLSGSCSAMTNRQVERYVASGAPALRLDPRSLAESGPAPALSWLAAQTFGTAPMIYATAEPESVRAAQGALGTARAGEIVEETLAACATAARAAGVRRFIVAGGETSGAVTQALGLDRLEIGPEIAPGVPWTFSGTGGDVIALALKSGNFGQETFFFDAQDVVEGK